MRFDDGPVAEFDDGWLDTWSADLAEQARRTREMADEVAELSVSAVGADGGVRVTVDGSGQLADLRLDAGALRWSPDDLADEILATMRRAQQQLTPLVRQIAEETLGADSPVAREVAAGYATRFPEPRTPTHRTW